MGRDGWWKRKMKDMSLLVMCLVFSSIFTNTLSLTKEQENDRITALPGQPTVVFSQFSGYITVHKKHSRALFYWLTEAAAPNPHLKPLVLWLNGGPGCSSIAYGASEEIGPFRINKNASSLWLNKYSWNKEANILFLESPVGAGFSYTNTSSDLKSQGDKRTASDALRFLIRWMLRFPQYKYREFYITGESYAGHYVPQLTEKIHNYNKNHHNPIINLKGFMVGNALTDYMYDNIGTIEYWWSHSIILDTTYKSIMSSCDFTSPKYIETCDNALRYAWNYESGDIDEYSIYTPSCKKPSSNITSSRLKNSLALGRVSGYDPCVENRAEKYYNRPDVQHAMHANYTRIPYKWTACRLEILENWKDSQLSMLPTYKELITTGYRIWVYSGDTDANVPVTATRLWLSHLSLTVNTRWYPWYVNGQVGGWTEVYNGLTFATVRGAGHEVPLTQPERGFLLFESFLAGTRSGPAGGPQASGERKKGPKSIEGILLMLLERLKGCAYKTKRSGPCGNGHEASRAQSKWRKL